MLALLINVFEELDFFPNQKHATTGRLRRSLYEFILPDYEDEGTSHATTRKLTSD